TPRTQRALQQLLESHFTIGLCTGRHFATLKPGVLKYFPKDAHHIVAGGAQVIDTIGTVHWEKLIPYSVITEILDYLSSIDAKIILQHNAHMYGNPRALMEQSNSNKTESLVVMESIELLPQVDLPLIVAHSISPEQYQKINAHKALSAKYMQSYSGTWYVDITAQGVNKLTALRHWCDIKKIVPNEIIGFGDSENDIEFLQFIGCAVVVDNASDQVKKFAAHITGAYDEDGVAQWLEQNLRI
ncbi:HAD-IIB family hydrolase, partial [Candidatus Woesebacteria bacterium]|nr:HAD-IIB family hydrolase [Candidatus Woesebacteria bacterium]